MRIVTLTTDFGLQDAYVGSMKGVILSGAPDVRIVDITHDIPPRDVLLGRLRIEDAFRYFPGGTVHVGVIDPEVGSQRRPLIVSAFGHFFVGPDNGLFGFALRDPERRFWRIREELFPDRRGATFDGRDLFAPAAARLAVGAPPAELGKPLDAIQDVHLPEPRYSSRESSGEVIAVDHYGNLITNLLVAELGTEPRDVVLEGKEIGPIRASYSDVPEYNFVALGNSMGRLEIAVRQGSAEKVLKARRGMKVVVRKVAK